MMDEYPSSLYPSLHERVHIPIWYLPSCLTLSVLPFLVSRSRPFLVINTTILSLLCIRLPFYTFGDSASDYYNSGPIIALLPWYIDFVLCTPWKGDAAPVYTGSRGSQRFETLRTTYEKLVWAIRLMLPAQRGIGWNWMVKGVPKAQYMQHPAWASAARHLAWAVWFYAQSVVYLVILGWSLTCEKQSSSRFLRCLATGLVSWCGAAWVWTRLACAYDAAAAITIGARLCDLWEWPPLMGPLAEAWSVRQMWSVVYHQQLRRQLARPTIAVTRLLGVRKGSALSGHLQTVITFALSCLFHQLQMYNACRTSAGERAFFMAQPVAIILEDFIQKSYRSSSLDLPKTYVKYLGYTWVIVWFAATTHPYVRGLVHAGIVEDWILLQRPLALGASLFHSGDR